ncbi:MAG: TIGR02449 family protein [Gammaproteobacteria bacterium]|nr:TIGR02449 family protein [Gammaproteobacteria bacterium]MBU1724099.1 TIGR02449 family protein [Gammaproteobacteria bacterium]MBU2006825.1 TIGR02449 family protein [Gammaproteobacteria bacterium]
MNAQTPDMNLKNQLTSIEERVERLLGLVEKLGEENSDLKKREKALASECSDLRRRNTKASSQIEEMIQRLKQQPPGA